MWSRNILIAAAAAALSATPVLAQQTTPATLKPVAAVSRDSTHAKPRKHARRHSKKTARNSNAATPATPATPATAATPASPAATTTLKPEQRKAKHSSKSEQKKGTTEAKKP